MTSTDAPTVQVELGSRRRYDIFFDRLSKLPERMRTTGLRPGKCVLVTDENVGMLYGEAVAGALSQAGFDCAVVTLEPGEATKSMGHLQLIYDAALSRGVERSTPLVALGGGVIGDVAGFAAATLLRGLPLVQVPTSLIAQVDSAIGGKTGMNHAAGKNLIGAFHQPRLVLADPSVLQSLPNREWTSGLAEVVKHGLISDSELFGDLEAAWDHLFDRRQETVERLVPRAARVKAAVVADDEREAGRRETLNFGHTFGHAIERVAGYGTLTHGEAVAAGMRAALHLSRRRMPRVEAERADALVSRIPVPPQLGELDVSALIEAMAADKKVREGRLRLVLLERIGHAYVTDDVPREQLEAAWRFARAAAGQRAG
jgi:3-dehydroquinate synthase